jgi:phosphate transport system substrate-binding protein
VSPQWKSQLGTGQAVAWPTGIGANGSAGVAATVENTPGTIGYTDTAFAIANHLHFASIKNAAGNYINPSIRNVAAAAATVKSVPANGELHIVNPPHTNKNAYPMATFTYVLVPHQSANGAALRKVIFWALTQGQSAKYTAKLWFAPIPKPVLVYSEKALTTINAT